MKHKHATNASEAAVNALLRYDSDGAFINIVSSHEANVLDDPRDRRLAVAIAHGTVEKLTRLDYVAGKLLSRAIGSLTPHTRAVIRAALYQLMYMQRPPHALVNEAVALGKHAGERALINAVLRHACRDSASLFDLPPREKDPIRFLSLAYAMPKDKVRILVEEYGMERTESLLNAYQQKPPLCLRVNTTLISRDDLVSRLNENPDVRAEISPISPDGIRVFGVGNPTTISGWGEGLFFVQDESSQLALRALAPAQHKRILDVCAGLGGKTFGVCALTDCQSEITASDLYEDKISNLQLHAQSLQFNNINFCCHDATLPFSSDLKKFDFVIADVPCSGLGVMRRKPDLRHRAVTDIVALPSLQKKILTNAAEMLDTGGRLLYSTCTIRRAENRAVVDDFLTTNTAFTLLEDRTFLPDEDGCDGFYYAILTRII